MMRNKSATRMWRALLLFAPLAHACVDDPDYQDVFGYKCADWVISGVSDCSTTSSGYIVTCGQPLNSQGQNFHDNRGANPPLTTRREDFPPVDTYGAKGAPGSMYYGGYWSPAQTLEIQTKCQKSCESGSAEDDASFVDVFGYKCADWVIDGVSDCSTTSSGYIVTCGQPLNSQGQNFHDNRGANPPLTTRREDFPPVGPYGAKGAPGSMYYGGYWSPAQTLEIQTKCPKSCNMCPHVGASKDPHFRLPHGGRTDIRGEDGGIYNLLSAKNLAFNAEFASADFQWSKRIVHGTKMSAAYWTVRTDTNQTVSIAYSADTAKGGHANITVDGNVQKHLTESRGPFKLSNLAAAIHGRKLTVETNLWRMVAGVNAFPFAALNKGKLLLDIEVYPLYDADKDPVAPHGIFGQAYDDDDLAIDGTIDKATAVEMTTKAQGEGAIEGVIADYRVAAPFATTFKYSRFDAVSAPHRDTSKLTGLKRHVGKTVSSVGGAHHNEVEA